jgi:hypothetical protein
VIWIFNKCYTPNLMKYQNLRSIKISFHYVYNLSYIYLGIFRISIISSGQLITWPAHYSLLKNLVKFVAKFLEEIRKILKESYKNIARLFFRYLLQDVSRNFTRFFKKFAHTLFRAMKKMTPELSFKFGTIFEQKSKLTGEKTLSCQLHRPNAISTKNIYVILMTHSLR